MSVIQVFVFLNRALLLKKFLQVWQSWMDVLKMQWTL